MAYMDFKDLQDQVLSRGYGEVDRTRVKAWINEAGQDVNHYRRWSWDLIRSNVATVAGTESIAQPATQMYLARIEYTDTNGALIPVDFFNPTPEQPFLSFGPLERGRPLYYTPFADTSILLRPIPDAVYTLSVSGYQRWVQLSADSSVPSAPAEHRMVYVYGALKKAAERDKAYDAAAYYEAQFQEAMAGMVRYEDTIRHRGGPERASLPASYQR